MDKDKQIHDWDKAANKNRDRLMRICFGLEKEVEPQELSPDDIEDPELALTEEDCFKDTTKIEPPNNTYLGWLGIDLMDLSKLDP